MARLYFSKFYGKMRFPIFCTIRINYEHWKKRESDVADILIGSWRKPKEATFIGSAWFFNVKQSKFGTIPAPVLEFDTGLKYFDAEELFSQMHKTQWDGDNTEVALITLFWLKRSQAFYGYREDFNRTNQIERDERRSIRREREKYLQKKQNKADQKKL